MVISQVKSSKPNAVYALSLLFVINTFNFFDRLIIGALGEPIRKEFQLGDSTLGLLSTAFILVYAFAGLPLGRLADTKPRPVIISAGVAVWSLFTAASGMAQTYWQIFLFRIGVGIGEASCAPAATSLISDLFPTERRARAMSVFMLGLPVGITLSFYISGTLASAYGWRTAFIVAGLPGIVLAIAVLFIREPRTFAESAAETQRTPFRKILRSRTMWWLIASGALHNFSLYALSTFMTPYLMRFHGLEIREASLAAMFVNGICTLPGLLLGGYLGDRLDLDRRGRSLILVGVVTLISLPLFLFATSVTKGSIYFFVILMGSAFALMYFYYSITYSTISEINRPQDRATAMSVYFLAMYVLGGALGPFIMGALSDRFTKTAAQAAGVTDFTQVALEPFRGAGLQSAMYVVPVACLFLAITMFGAAGSFRKEVRESN